MIENKKSYSVSSGFIWGFMEKVSAQAVSFVVSLVLARLLDPSDYGAIAIINIFIALANVFVSSGLGNALIQKKDADELDFSSVFYVGLGVAVVMMIVVCVSAPAIASLYGIQVLCPTLRVMSLGLIVSAFTNIQYSYISKNMLFRMFFFSTIWATVISAVIGIFMAYNGFGIWALVVQYLSSRIVVLLVLLFTVRWRPRLIFSFVSVKSLFSYGWKLLVSELINTVYLEIRSLVIGLKYSSDDLAYYNKGQSFPKLFVSNINASLQSVLFPVMSNMQDEKAKVKELTRKSIRLNSYIITPIVFGLAIVAEPMIEVILTEKWLSCVPYLQLYCLFYAFMPIQAACLQVIKALGHSDMYLKLEVLKKVVGVIILLVSIPFGVFAIALGAVIANIFAALINVIPTKKLLGYSYIEQIRDYLNCIIPLAGMMASCFIVGVLPINNTVLVLLQVFVGVLSYVILSVITKNESFNYVINIIKRMLLKK